MNSSTPTSIKNLPPELLARIFQFTDDDDHCLVTRESGLPDILENSLGYPEQPHTLSHVCSAWRRIALATPSFWSHIDITIDHELNPQLFTRAKIYAQRAGRHPLEVHFIDTGLDLQQQRSMKLRVPRLNFSECDDLCEFKFLESSAACIGSLAIEIRVVEHFRKAHFAAAEYFLTKCTPGLFTCYTTRLSGSDSATFLDTSSDPQRHISQLEGWEAVKVIHLDGFGPRWGSKSYHGLVDLRLGRMIPDITTTQFVDILKASPGLRILHLNNRINSQIAEGTTITPARLDELEVLKIAHCDHSVGKVVRWIQPGIKPLRFTLLGAPTEIAVDFFKRSNITSFRSGVWDSPLYTRLLREAPRLQTLVLDAFYYDVDSIGIIIDQVEREDPLSPLIPIQIDTLYLMGFRKLRLSDIQEAVDRYSIRRIFLSTCRLAFQPSTDKKEIVYRDKTTILQKLSEIKNCPVIEFLTGRIPFSDWE